jgi:hypothetical protein
MTNNPLDVSTMIPQVEDNPHPLPPQGIPGLISADAIVQAFVNVLEMEVQKLNDFALADYNGLVTHWKSDNAAGVYRPAPGPVTLAMVDPIAAAQYEVTGVGFNKIFSFFTQFDPSAPPGTVFQPLVTPPPEKTAESVGGLIPGTEDLYLALGGPYDPSEFGKSVTTVTGHFHLVNMTPMGWKPAWRKTQ